MNRQNSPSRALFLVLFLSLSVLFLIIAGCGDDGDDNGDKGGEAPTANNSTDPGGGGGTTDENREIYFQHCMRSLECTGSAEGQDEASCRQAADTTAGAVGHEGVPPEVYDCYLKTIDELRCRLELTCDEWGAEGFCTEEEEIARRACDN